MPRKLPYNEGTWFAVPLRTTGYGIGIVTRMAPRGRLFGYFFGPARTTAPALDEVVTLTPEDAVLRIRFGDLGLLEGTWPIIGHAANFDRTVWPLPPFIRIDDITGKAFKDTFSDSLDFVAQEPCDPELARVFPENALWGYRAVESELSEHLAGPM